MKISPHEPVVVVKAVLGGPQGETEIEMALDTGATYMMIPWDISQKPGYDPAISKERVRLVTASGTEIAPMVTLEHVEVLGIRIPGVKVACHDLPETSRVQGLLGLSFLKHCNLRLEYNSGQITLEDC